MFETEELPKQDDDGFDVAVYIILIVIALWTAAWLSVIGECSL